ncbi:MAG: thiamine-phosphate kinase [Desulfobacterales bacterium]|nr:thiamine-phosphate kinase [Desulfobacterales bacterium]
MKLRDIGEFGLIERIRRGCLIRPEGVVKAIGDDAAAFYPDAGRLTLVSTDLLVERIHFFRDDAAGFTLGRKSLAVNLSDIAAMGGRAREAFVSIGAPGDVPVAFLEDLYDGMKSLAAEFRVNILGGDFTGSAADVIINVVVLGSVSEEEMLRRDAAKSGDVICVTGFLGESRAGLHLIQNRIPADDAGLERLRQAHLAPRPHLAEGRFLAGAGGVHAAIDVSDGLAGDLGHILNQSQKGARLYDERLPISRDLEKFCARFELDPVEHALAGGEDYVLLCTLSPRRAGDILKRYEETFNRPLHPVGEITDSGVLERILPDGRVRSPRPAGWDHFSRT